MDFGYISNYCYFTYSVPLAVAALYHDTIESKALPPWAERAWGRKEYAELKGTEVMRFCAKRIKAIGIA